MTHAFFVVLLAAYPVLFIATTNPGQVSSRSFAIALVTAACGSLVVQAALRVLLRSWDRAALCAAILLVLFYAYGPAHTAIEFALLDWRSSTTRLTGVVSAVLSTLHLSMTAVGGFLAYLGLRIARRLRPAQVEGAVRAVNLFALALIALVVVQWWRGGEPAASGQAQTLSALDGDGLRTSVLGYNPDVYVVVLDGYAREDVLHEQYGFDNSAFLNGLRSRGFSIGSGSTANYHWTFLSLASVLNMDYVQTLLGESVAPNARSRHAVYEAIRNSAVHQFLSSRGYRTIHLQSTWGATLENKYADVDIPCRASVFKDDFIRTLIDASWLKTLQSRANADLAACHLANFETLAQLGHEAGPKLVFAHFLLPHYPYLFDRNGRILERATFSNQFDFQRQLWEERQRYIDQLVFLNGRITQTIDRILAASQRPPVIVLMSDHGPNIHKGLAQGEILRVRFASLGAFLLPGAPADVIPPASSLVNLFRRVLGFYFDADLPVLPDRYYTSPFEKPYQLEDVKVVWPSTR